MNLNPFQQQLQNINTPTQQQMSQANQNAKNISNQTQMFPNFLKTIGLGAIPDTMNALGQATQGSKLQMPKINPINALKDAAGLASYAVIPGGEAVLGSGLLARLGTGALTGALSTASQQGSTGKQDLVGAGTGAAINAILPGVGNLISKGIEGAPVKNALNVLTPYLGNGIADIAKDDPNYVINLAKKMTSDPAANIDTLTNEFKGDGGVGATVTNMRKSTQLMGSSIDDFYNQTSKDMFDQHVSDANIANFLKSKTAATNVTSMGQPVRSSMTDLDRIQGEGVRSLEYDDTKERADAIIRKNVGEKVNNPVYQQYSKMYSLVRKNLNKLENIRGDTDKLEKLGNAHKISVGKLGTMDTIAAIAALMGKGPLAGAIEAGKQVFQNRDAIGANATRAAAAPVMQGLNKIMSPAINNPLMRMFAAQGGSRAIGGIVQ